MKQIIAMGGGGFSMEPENPLLDQYVLQQTGKPRPKICFFPHATDDAVRYVNRFFTAFAQLDCIPSTLSLYQTPPMRDMEGFLLGQDAIYVGGGNTCWPCGASGTWTRFCASAMTQAWCWRASAPGPIAGSRNL